MSEPATPPETEPTAQSTAEATANPIPPVNTQPLLTRSDYLRLIARWLLVALAIYAIVSLLIGAQSALTPFILGLVLAYLLLPIVNRLNKRMPRWLAILFVYIGLGVLIGISVAYIIPPAAEQIGQLVESIP
ncbi:MAG: AI-2E family transporter, partial [Roseiflexaceae bacterium]|nr:AI-2E family transporter [Roseiflexaceae bacterium]